MGIGCTQVEVAAEGVIEEDGVALVALVVQTQ